MARVAARLPPAVADIKPARNVAVLEPLLWGLGSALLRIPFFPLTEQDIDGANFARAVEHFDIAAWAPHPPGYPLLIAAGKLVRALVSTDASRSLAVFSLLCSALLATSVFVVMHRLFNKATARLSIALLFASPLLCLFAVRPLSDGPGAGLAWASLACALVAAACEEDGKRDRYACFSLFFAALLPGVRLSALPFVVPAVVSALCAARRPKRVFLVGVFSLLAWLLPFLALVDLRVLTGRTLGHIHGHFYEYGGSVLSASDPVARGIALFRALFAFGLGGVWSDRPVTTLFVTAALVLLAGGAFHSLRQTPVLARRTFLACVGLYLVWVVLGQNIIEQPRHVLPLIPALLGPLAHSILHISRSPRFGFLRRLLIWVGFCAAVFEANRLAWIQARYPAPIVRIARFCEAQPDAPTLVVATYRFYRWIGWRAPHVRVESVGSLEDAIALAARTQGRVLVTSEVPGAERLDPAATELRVSTDLFVRFVLEDVRLIDLRNGLHAKPTPK